MDTALVTWELGSIFYVQKNTTDKKVLNSLYEVWNFNSGNYLFTTDTK